MGVAERIKGKLTEAFAPQTLHIADQSHRHAGHAGHHGSAHGDGESHFAVEMVAAAFAGLSRVERHRRVNAVLAEELAGPVHALALTLRTPEEAAR